MVGNALEWFTNLEHMVKARIDKILDEQRTIVRDEAERKEKAERAVTLSSTPTVSRSCTPIPRHPGPPPSTPTSRRPVPPAPSPPATTANPFPEPPPRMRPSDYFLSRCPLCFGNLNTMHPSCAPLKKPSKQLKAIDDEEDDFEGPNLKVSRSVLNDCESSFKAADEKREKASTRFFDDTGIMALLCHHDRVLWLVNMRTAGEKQYHMLVLLETLFQQLPADIRVGILYDIACQLHCSCVKYDFLDRYMDHISFAVPCSTPLGILWFY
ncbi:hypothetical protein C8R43DRAFT_1143831 [Mycena crocata]|nr:hypothetical protein C8R43DRAFT_1143831 [Mycena crocata]